MGPGWEEEAERSGDQEREGERGRTKGIREEPLTLRGLRGPFARGMTLTRIHGKSNDGGAYPALARGDWAGCGHLGALVTRAGR